jgi:hypothetical protein
MKTTVDPPDDLMREVKIWAVTEKRKLKEAMADLLRRGLSRRDTGRKAARRVSLPLVRCAHDARGGEEMTPERVGRLLLAEDAEAARGPLR